VGTPVAVVVAIGIVVVAIGIVVVLSGAAAARTKSVIVGVAVRASPQDFLAG
jgi:hypothetical protein